MTPSILKRLFKKWTRHLIINNKVQLHSDYGSEQFSDFLVHEQPLEYSKVSFEAINVFYSLSKVGYNPNPY